MFDSQIPVSCAKHREAWPAQTKALRGWDGVGEGLGRNRVFDLRARSSRTWHGSWVRTAWTGILPHDNIRTRILTSQTYSYLGSLIKPRCDMCGT